MSSNKMINNIGKAEIERRKTISDKINAETDHLTFGETKEKSKQSKFYRKIRDRKDELEIKRLMNLKPEDYFNHLLD